MRTAKAWLRVKVEDGFKRYEIKDANFVISGESVVISGDVAEVKRDYTCKRCGGPDAFDQYTVKDQVWALTGLGPKGGMLHFKCLEAVIGRPIELDDLSDAEWNKMLKHVLSRK